MKLEKRARPAFAHWRYDHGLSVRATADALERIAGRRIVSHEKVRTICLPWTHPERTAPDDELLAAISVLTDCAVVPEDFSPPDLQPAQAAAA